MTATIEGLRAAGIVSPLDAHFARTMGRLAREDRPEVLLAAALASRHVSNGHVCLDLRRLVAGAPLVNDAGEPFDDHAWPDLDGWIATLQSSGLVGDGSGATPLVLDDRGRLYLRRYWQHEQRLAGALQARALSVDSSLDAAWLRTALDRLFPRDPALDAAEPDWQRIAAVLALQRHFCVISGGPGTGKTFTVVKLLALLIEQAMQRGRRLPRVTLLAPTGKAAARLSESIQRTKGSLHCADDVRLAIPDQATTIHRCLSPIAGSATRFRYHADNPLCTDLVLVDEASMVDLALMTRLVAAVPPQARLVLLGDKDQLASVEAGAVLGDICNTGTAQPYSHVLTQTIAALSGDRLPLDAGAPHATGICDCIVQLTRSYRYAAQSGIGALARAINAGDSAAALAILESEEHTDVVRVEPAGAGDLSESLRHAVMEGFGPYLRERTPGHRLRAFERFRVLCAHRRGYEGVETINRRIEAALEDADLLHVGGASYVGRPVMVTRNDYPLNLFNGDVGIIAEDGEHGTGTVACFAAHDGPIRRLSPSRLPPHETVFAMSVHKSQGSEFDEVAVLLPERSSPVVTRELLYTAVTRPRRKLVIHASREMIVHAITQRTERGSGLRDLLWAR